MELANEDLQRRVGVHSQRRVHADPQKGASTPRAGGGVARLRGSTSVVAVVWAGSPPSHESLQESGMEGGVEAQAVLARPGHQRLGGGRAKLLKSVAGTQTDVPAVGQMAHRSRLRPGSGKRLAEIGSGGISVGLGRSLRSTSGSGQQG